VLTAGVAETHRREMLACPQRFDAAHVGEPSVYSAIYDGLLESPEAPRAAPP